MSCRAALPVQLPLQQGHGASTGAGTSHAAAASPHPAGAAARTLPGTPCPAAASSASALHPGGTARAGLARGPADARGWSRGLAHLGAAAPGLSAPGPRHAAPTDSGADEFPTPTFRPAWVLSPVLARVGKAAPDPAPDHHDRPEPLHDETLRDRGAHRAAGDHSCAGNDHR